MMKRVRGMVLGAGALFTLASCDVLTTVHEPVGLSISAVALDLVLDEQQVLRAWLLDERGQTIGGTPEWRSSDPAVATIGKSDGVVNAINVGTTTMTASYGYFSATTFVTVRSPNPPNTVAILQTPLAVIAGISDSLFATAYDAKGRPTSVPVRWSSADPAVATVGAVDGVLAGIGAGTTTITATAGTISASFPMTVVELTSSLSFTRWDFSDHGFSSDVVTYSSSDRRTEPIERTAGFTHIGAPAWSKDGASMAIEVIDAFVYDPGSHIEDYYSDVYVKDVTSGSPWRRLTTNRLSKSPQWSPDGSRIAYLKQEQLFLENNIYVVDVLTGVQVRVTARDGWYGPPSWSPDGKRLTFAGWVDFDNYLLSNWDVFIINVDGTGLINATNDTAADYSPSWSPDGSKIAFTSWRGTTTLAPDGAVYVMDADGPVYKRLSSGFKDLSDVAWSPDGHQIAFAAGRSIYVMNADGSLPARLTRANGDLWDRSPSWRR
jgi:hypothetical protein